VSRYPDFLAGLEANLRCSKLVSTIVSTFTANYVYSWSTFFPETPLSFPLPTFDGRAVCYPGLQNLRDYLSWRQVDCTFGLFSESFLPRLNVSGHINNLYNTTFWSLIQLGGLDNKDAERTLAVGFSVADDLDISLT
jgi:tRNA(His) guanylyltransferase